MDIKLLLDNFVWKIFSSIEFWISRAIFPLPMPVIARGKFKASTRNLNPSPSIISTYNKIIMNPKQKELLWTNFLSKFQGWKTWGWDDLVNFSIFECVIFEMTFHFCSGELPPTNAQQTMRSTYEQKVANHFINNYCKISI